MTLKTSAEQTINISQLTDEQLDALLSGSLSWDEAYAVAPGPQMTIIEYEPQDLPDEDEEDEEG